LQRRQGKYLRGDTSSTPIPTHYFLIVIRCLAQSADLNDCGSLAESDVISFIIPNYENEPCHAVSVWLGFLFLFLS